MSGKKTTEEFIIKAREVHEDKYDYSKTDYINSKTPVIIICPEHGEFTQKPYVHINHKSGCSKCSGTYKPTTEEFIIKAREVHGDTYDYSKTIYTNARKSVIIICPLHGEFTSNPDNHLNKKCGCQICGYIEVKKKRTSNSLKFIIKAREVHGDTYNYLKTVYINARKPVIIICPEHGEFSQVPDNHVNKKAGCSKCCYSYKPTTEEFVIKAREVHGDTYDYSKTDYVNSKTPVIIICPLHREFSQLPDVHVNQKSGCYKCSGKYKPTTEEFVIKAREVHGDTYDYSKINYVNSKTPVIIICPLHGEFSQLPDVHVKQKSGCYKCKIYGASKISFDWLEYQELSCIIQHKKNGGEYIIPFTKYRVDGFCHETNTIYEFNGDYWHGNPKIYNSSLVNPSSKKTFGELYENTIKKKQYCIELKYNYIEIWESEWRLAIKLVKIIQKNFRKNMKIKITKNYL